MNTIRLFLLFTGILLTGIVQAQDEKPKLTKKQQKMVAEWEASMAEEEAYKSTQNKADNLFREKDYKGAITQYEKLANMRPDEAAYFKAKIADIRIIIQREEARKAALAKAELEAEARPEQPVKPEPIQTVVPPKAPKPRAQPTISAPKTPVEPEPKKETDAPTAEPLKPEPTVKPEPKADPPPRVIPPESEKPEPKPEVKPEPKPEPKKVDPKEKAIQDKIAEDVKAAKVTARKEMEAEKKAEVVKATQPKAVKAADEVVDAEGNPYPEGMTEEVIEKKNVTIIKRIIVKGREVDVYQKATHRWGGVFFFKNDQGVSERIWIAETGKP